MLRSGQHDEVGHAAGQQAHEGNGAVGPLLAQRAAAGAADVDVVEGPGERIEARGIDDHVEMEVDVQMQRAAETLDQRHRASRCCGVVTAGGLDQMIRDWPE